jgi:hypothetical protein
VLVTAYENRMMNIHPSLLPSFPGLDVQKKAIDHGCKIAGCTVHFVTEGVDEGPIIIQAAVPILEGRYAGYSWPLASWSRNTASTRARFNSTRRDKAAGGRTAGIGGGRRTGGDGISQPRIKSSVDL